MANTAVAGRIFRAKEKRLDANLWMYRGVNRLGSHFPICAYSNNPGRRSPAAVWRRQLRVQEKRQAPHASWSACAWQGDNGAGAFARRHDNHSVATDNHNVWWTDNHSVGWQSSTWQQQEWARRSW